MTDGRAILRQRLDDVVAALRAMPDRAIGIRDNMDGTPDDVAPVARPLPVREPTARELHDALVAAIDEPMRALQTAWSASGGFEYGAFFVNDRTLPPGHSTVATITTELDRLSGAGLSAHVEHLALTLERYATALLPDEAIRAAVLAREDVWGAVPLANDDPKPTDTAVTLGHFVSAPGPDVEVIRRPGWLGPDVVLGEPDDGNPFHPSRAAPVDVKAWAWTDTAAWITATGLRPNGWIGAVLYLAERDVRSGLVQPMMYADAGPVHRRAVRALQALKTSDEPGKLATWRHPTRSERRLLGPLEPTDDRYQLTLFGGSAPPAAVVEHIRRIAGATGLKAYAALLVMASNQGRPSDAFTVTPEAYLDALGVSRGDTRARARWLTTLRGLLRLRLERIETSGARTRTSSVRILTIWTEVNEDGPTIDQDDESSRFIAGKLQFHPDLYKGVREQSGAIGRRFGVFPAALATLDETACMLGWALFFYMTGEIRHGRTGARLTAETLFGYAGIGYSQRRNAACLGQLDAALGEMVRVGYLRSARWDVDGTARNAGTCADLTAGEWILDRMARGLRPPDDYAVAIPTNGDELREWREKQGQTQAEAADALGVHRRTLIRAEADGAKPLTATLRKAIGDGR